MQNTSHQPAENLSDHGVRPIQDQVLVRQDPPKERLESGLYLAGAAARELQEDIGTVIAIGPGRIVAGERVPMSVEVGDRVMFRRRAESALIPDPRLGGSAAWKDLLVLRDEDMVAVLEQ